MGFESSVYCALEVRRGTLGKRWALCKIRGYMLARFVPKEKKVNEKQCYPGMTWLAKPVGSV